MACTRSGWNGGRFVVGTLEPLLRSIRQKPLLYNGDSDRVGIDKGAASASLPSEIRASRGDICTWRIQNNPTLWE